MRPPLVIGTLSAALAALLVAGTAAGLRPVPIGPLPPEQPPPAPQPGDERDAVCDGRRLPLFERRVLAAQYFRGDMNFRSDREYVERSLRDPSFRRVEGFDTPLSAVERRHMREWSYFDASPAARYVERHARNVSGGIAIERRYPVVSAAVHLTADFERHAAGLGELRIPTQIVPVRFTEAQLDRAAAAVGKDFDLFEPDGIDIVSVSSDVTENEVDVEIISPRPDAAAVVEARFGPPVQATVIGTRHREPVCVAVQRYRRGRSGRTLRITWRTFRAYRFRRLAVRETGRSVLVGAIMRAPVGPITLLPEQHSRLVRLKAPLGDRRVRDGETGRPLRKLRRARR